MKPTVIPAVFKAKDEMSKEIEKMQKGVAGFNAKMQAAGKQSFAVGKKALVVGAMIAAPLVLAAKTAVDFEAKMSNVATLIDTNKESIAGIGDEVLAMSRKLPVSIDDLTSSLYDIRSAGIPAAQAMATLESASKLSVAGLSSVAEATNISTSAMNAFKSENLSVAQTNDILFKTVKYGKTTIAEMASGFGAVTSSALSANVSLAQLSASTAALTSVGVPTAQSQTMLKALFSEMARDSGKLADAYKKQTQGNISLDTTGKGYYETLQKLYESTGKNDTAFKNMFSSVEAGGAALSLITNASESYKSTLMAMTEGPEALSEAFDKQSKTGKAGLQVLKNNMESLSITVGNALLPVINNVVSSLAPLISQAANWIGRNKALVSTIVKVAAGAAALALGISAVSYSIGIYQKAAVVAKFAQMAWNVAMSANPIGLMIGTIAVLGTAIHKLYKAYGSVITSESVATDVRKKALEQTLDQRVEMTMLFNTLRKTKENTDEYRSALQKIEEIQPGITAKYNLQAKSLENISRAEKELAANIMKRAEAEVRAEMLKDSIREEMRLREEGPGFMNQLLGAALGSFGGVQGQVGMINYLHNKDISQEQSRQGILSNQIAAAEMSATTDEAAAKPLSQKIELLVNGDSVGFVDQLQGKKVNTTTNNSMPLMMKTL
jgi:TP901 family phage tail tape measure protein